MFRLIAYIIKHYYTEIKLKLDKYIYSMPDEKYHICRALFSRHPKDFKQDIEASIAIGKLYPDEHRIIIISALYWCENKCDNITESSEDADCSSCHMLSLKPFTAKWMPERVQFIDRFGVDKEDKIYE